MTKNVIAVVSSAGIGVSLGYVTVAGFWRDAGPHPVPWKRAPRAAKTKWTPRRAPATKWGLREG